MKILLVDDDTLLLEQLCQCLKKQHHTVVEAENGQEGWKKFIEEPENFDLVLSDLKTPVCDGIDLLKQVRHEGYQTPFIIITGYRELDLAIEALKLGAFDFIFKPFNFEILNNALAKLTSLQVPKQELRTILPHVRMDVSISFESKLHLITIIRSYFQNLFEEVCLTHQLDPHNVSLCLWEALTNAVVHGNLEVPSSLKEKGTYGGVIKERENDPAYAMRQVSIHYQLKETELIFEIQDEGNGFDWKNLHQMDDSSRLLEYGRGILMILNMMDKVSWNDSGNRIQMVKYLTKANEQ